jgi:prepilin-type N-terminal cleavage/methylation domain-containing protein
MKRTNQKGMSLMETVVATAILLIVSSGVMGTAIVATATTDNQGHLAARTTEYAQDKMEQLLGLASGDSVSDTTQMPTAGSGGTGLTVGGSTTPNSPAALYVDYLDASGNLLASSGTTAPSSWFYRRVWAVSQYSTNVKQITVVTMVAKNVGGRGKLVQTTLTALKANPF